MKYTITEYNEGNVKSVFEGTEREVFEYLQNADYYIFLDESESNDDREEFVKYRKSLDSASVDDIYLPDYSWYKIEITGDDK